MSRSMVIAVDFDGTCVTYEYPMIGREIGAASVLKELVKADHRLILWTMRGDNQLQDAVEWFRQRDIELWGVQKNPEQGDWTSSPKAFANLYIDDAALGCPLLAKVGTRAYVDWVTVREMLIDRKFLP